MQSDLMVLVSDHRFIHIFKCFSCSDRSLLRCTLLCQVINTKDHIL